MNEEEFLTEVIEIGRTKGAKNKPKIKEQPTTVETKEEPKIEGTDEMPQVAE